MSNINKNITLLMIVYILGDIFIANLNFNFSFMNMVNFLSLIIFVILKIYFPKSLVSYIIGLLNGIFILYPVFNNIIYFNQYTIQILIDTIAGILLIIYCLYMIKLKMKTV